MGYHHDQDGFQLEGESPFEAVSCQRALRHELQPLEVRRMLWEGATLVQRTHPLRDALQGALQLEETMTPKQIRSLLPDVSQPLLCVGLGGDGGVHDAAIQLADQLLSLGYRYVFCLASGIRGGMGAGG